MADNFEEFEQWVRRVQAKRQAAQIQARNEQRTLVDQLQRFGVCPCVALGRYSTCCAKLLTIRDGFYYIKWSTHKWQ